MAIAQRLKQICAKVFEVAIPAEAEEGFVGTGT